MKPLHVLHVDENHPILIEELQKFGFNNVVDYSTPLEILLPQLYKYSGIVIRSRFPIDQQVIDAASNLKFIARLGAGLENIDSTYAQKKKIKLFSAKVLSLSIGKYGIDLSLSIFNFENSFLLSTITNYAPLPISQLSLERYHTYIPIMF